MPANSFQLAELFTVGWSDGSYREAMSKELDVYRLPRRSQSFQVSVGFSVLEVVGDC